MFYILNNTINWIIHFFKLLYTFICSHINAPIPIFSAISPCYINLLLFQNWSVLKSKDFLYELICDREVFPLYSSLKNYIISLFKLCSSMKIWVIFSPLSYKYNLIRIGFNFIKKFGENLHLCNGNSFWLWSGFSWQFI